MFLIKVLLKSVAFPLVFAFTHSSGIILMKMISFAGEERKGEAEGRGG